MGKHEFFIRFKFKLLMKFRKAIVRDLSSSYLNCISDFPYHHLLNLNKAKSQHHDYINILKEMNIEIITLQGDANHPDCCFVEDTAVIKGNKAVITRPGIESRRGEVGPVENALREFKDIEVIEYPGTLEGGDIIHIHENNLLICGNSSRTNIEGIKQLSSKLDCNLKIITDPEIVHLKSYVTYLGNNMMLGTSKYLNHDVFSDFTSIVVPENESYAANSLAINDQVIIPNGYPRVKQLIQDNGFDVILLDMSEFQKCEGALTCLSLLF